MENAYIKLTTYYEMVGMECNVSYDDFVSAYEASGSDDISVFLGKVLDEIDSQLSETASPVTTPPDAETNSGSFGGNSDWFYNTGTSLPRAAKYSSYNYLSAVRKGDILYEESASSGSLLHHCAIVEGVFWDTVRNQFYIRIIEAIDQGVCRGICDETRTAEKKGKFLRVNNTSEMQRNKAVNFCISQLGKPYFVYPGATASANNSSWYCSELVWAAYYNQNIFIGSNMELEGTFLTPNAIYTSSNTSVISTSTTKPASYYTDISSHWAKSSITLLVNGGVMDSSYQSRFYPDNGITRETFVRMLYKMAGSPSPGISYSPYPDVNSSHTYYMAVLWAHGTGILKGYEDGTFRPYTVVTREQLVTFLYRYAKYYGYSTSYSASALNGFTDASNVSSFATIPMKWAVSKNLINGTTTTTLSPKENCKRCEGATVIHRFLNIFM